jgi:hypothetical protein
MFSDYGFDDLLRDGFVSAFFPVRMNRASEGRAKNPVYYRSWTSYSGNSLCDINPSNKDIGAVYFNTSITDRVLVCVDVDSMADAIRIRDSGCGRDFTCGTVSYSGKLHIYFLLSVYDDFSNIRFTDTYDDGKASFEIFSSISKRHMFEPYFTDPDKKLWDNINRDYFFSRDGFESLLSVLGIRFRYDKDKKIISDMKRVCFRGGVGCRDLRVLLDLVPNSSGQVLCPFHSEEHPSALLSSNGEVLTDMHDDESYTVSRDGSALVRIKTNEVVRVFDTVQDSIIARGLINDDLVNKPDTESLSSNITEVSVSNSVVARQIVDDIKPVSDIEFINIEDPRTGSKINVPVSDVINRIRNTDSRTAINEYYKLILGEKVTDHGLVNIMKLCPFLRDVPRVIKVNNRLFVLDTDRNYYRQIMDFRVFLINNYDIFITEKQLSNVRDNIISVYPIDYSVIAFGNCLYNIVSGEFRRGVVGDPVLPYLHIDHDLCLDDGLRPVVGDCPVFEDEFIKRVCYSSGGDYDFVRGVYQTIGLLLMAGNPFKVIYMILGVPDSGKSLFAKLLNRIFGDANMEATLLDNLGSKDEGALVGKKVAYVSELDSKYNPNSSSNIETLLKARCGQDRLRIKAYYSDGYMVEPKDVYNLVLVGNETPFKTTNSSLLSKIYYVPFNKAVPEDERDPDFIDRLLPEIPNIILRSLNAILNVGSVDDLVFKFSNDVIQGIMQGFSNPYSVIFDILGVNINEESLSGENEDSMNDAGYYIPLVNDLYGKVDELAGLLHLQVTRDGYGSYKKQLASYLDIKSSDIKTKTVDGNKTFINLFIKKDKSEDLVIGLGRDIDE